MLVTIAVIPRIFSGLSTATTSVVIFCSGIGCGSGSLWSTSFSLFGFKPCLFKFFCIFCFNSFAFGFSFGCGYFIALQLEIQFKHLPVAFLFGIVPYAVIIVKTKLPLPLTFTVIPFFISDSCPHQPLIIFFLLAFTFFHQLVISHFGTFWHGILTGIHIWSVLRGEEQVRECRYTITNGCEYLFTFLLLLFFSKFLVRWRFIGIEFFVQFSVWETATVHIGLFGRRCSDRFRLGAGNGRSRSCLLFRPFLCTLCRGWYGRSVLLLFVPFLRAFGRRRTTSVS